MSVLYAAGKMCGKKSFGLHFTIRYMEIDSKKFTLFFFNHQLPSVVVDAGLFIDSTCLGLQVFDSK